MLINSIPILEAQANSEIENIVMTTDRLFRFTNAAVSQADPAGRKGRRCDELAQMIDIGTTMLEHAKLEASTGMHGQAPSAAGAAGRDAVPIQYDTQRTQKPRPLFHTIIQDRWRLSLYLGKCSNELLGLEDDSGEMTNLSESVGHADVRNRLIE